MKGSIASALAAAATLASAQDTYSNPVIWQDLPDVDIFRVQDTFYYSASTMHYSPGAPVLRSYDLVNWEFIGHSVPELAFGDKYYLDGSGSAYNNGIWASSMRYRESNGLYYWYGCTDFQATQVFTAEDPAGPWTQHPAIPECYYDLGLLIDEDDTMYLAYGSYDIEVVQLSEDGLSSVRQEIVWSDNGRYLEGARFYNIDGSYYIWLTKPADEQHVLRADNPWGPYSEHSILEGIASPIPNSGTPHQGGIVDTPNGDWYYMGFLDAYPNGRIPVLAPLTWSDGWPNLVTDSNGGWGQSYPVPAIDTNKTVTPVGPFTDTFDGETLHPEFEWNHNPDNEAWSLGEGGLTLSTATVTTDFNAARNTLTHRILGPKSSGTFRLNLGNMAGGDISGVAIMRDESCYIGARKESDGSVTLINVNGIKMEDSNGWQTVSEGEVTDSTTEGLEAVASGEQDLWLRIAADVTPNFNGPAGQNTAQLEYSTDGESFQQLGPDFDIHTRWEFFMSHRFGVFNFATESLGGSVVVKGFDLQLAHGDTHQEAVRKAYEAMVIVDDLALPGTASSASTILNVGVYAVNVAQS